MGLAVAAVLAVSIRAFHPLPALEGGEGTFLSVAAGFVAAGALGLAAVAIRPRLVVIWSEWTLARMARRPWGLVARWAARGDDLVRRFADALVLLGRSFGWAHLRGAAWAVGGVASVAAGDWLATFAVGMPGDPLGLVFTHCTITAGAALLFALPVGQVGWDAAFAALLTMAAGLALPQALAVTAVVRLQQTLILVVGAFLLPFFTKEGAAGHTSTGIGASTAGS